MDNSARRKLTIKMVFGIAIPLLIMVVTLVMVGASFAWFSDAKEVTITTITMETAQAYTIDFSLLNGNLFENMKYAGQTAIAKDGGIISDAKCVNNPGNESNRAFSFVNVISLSTAGKYVDFTLNIDGALITKDAGNNTMRDYTSDPENIQYAFTWFFKEHTTGTTATNFTGSEEAKTQKYLPVSTKNETLYTPYGKILFDENGYAKSVNGSDKYLTTDGEEKSVSELSVLDAEQKIVAFNSSANENGMYDFYIVFAPEKLFWSQYFKGDLNEVTDADGNVTYTDNYTIATLYGDKVNAVTGGQLGNQMYYSGMDYLGAKFSFSAIINVLSIGEKEGA